MENLHSSRFTSLLNNIIIVIVVLLGMTSLSLLADTVRPSSYSLGVATPDWVKPVEIPQDYIVPRNTIQNGTYHLLVDEQTRLDAQRQVASFNRYVVQIVNQKGMAFNSQIDIEFDPVYQHVQLHKLQIIRDDAVLDKLSETEFSLLHNEQELSSQLYNGTRTLHAVIPDIRVGDMVEYSYTIVGDNPVFSGAYSQWHTLQWAVPLEALSISFLVHESIPFYHSFINLDGQLPKQIQGDEHFYTFRKEKLVPIYDDEDRPDWHSAKPHLLVSSRENWQQVVDWGVELFADPIAQSSTAIDALAQDIKNNFPEKQQQIMSAIDFVQNEIRYFGIELGESSHRPSFAQDTLARRFGDCKDKSVLLIALLRKLGVEADPVLVESDGFALLTEVVPAEGWFDHAIVRVRFQDKDFWVDPTAQMQFGNFEDIYQQPYGYGLVLKAGETDLQQINPAPVGEVISRDTWDLRDGKASNANFSTNVEFTGFNADYQRNKMASNAMHDIRNNYFEHYQHYYSSLIQDPDFSFEDDRQNNIVSYSFAYTVPDFWEEDDKEFSANFYSEGINYLLNEPDDIEREHPLALRYPKKVTQYIDIYLHDVNWAFDEETEVVSNDYFTFSNEVTYDDSQKLLRLKYSLENHQDHVPVSDLDSYLNDLKLARQHKNYGIVEYKNNSAASADSDSTATTPEPSAWQQIWKELGDVLTGIAIWLVSLVAFVILQRKYKKQYPYTGEANFYAVSKTKFLLMTLLTCGLYFYYWFYKNYQFEKAKHRPGIMPFWRALFHVLFYYPMFRTLTTRLKEDTKAESNDDVNELSAETDTTPTIEVPDYAIVLAVVFFGAQIVSNAMETWYTQVVVLCGLIMLPMLNMVSKANANNTWQDYNSGWHPRHLLLVPIFAPLSLYILASDLSLTPDTKVVEGKALYAHDVNFMVENDIISQDEEIAWFYSDAFLFISNDGNGVTSDSVFSYWKDDDDQLNVDRAKYNEIDDIKIQWSEEELENTIIEVMTLDGREFVLYVSNEDGLDKTFVQFLNRRLKQYR